MRMTAVTESDPFAGRSVREIEDRLGRTTLADEYIELADRVLTLRPLPAGAGRVAPDLFQGLGDALQQIAQALELDGLARQSKASLDQAMVDGDPAAIVQVIKQIATAVGANRRASAVLDGCLRQVEDDVQQLSQQEAGQRGRLDQTSKRIEETRTLAELEAQRRSLLTEVESLRDLSEQRAAALERIQSRSKAAQQRAELLLEQLSTATTSAHTDPLTGLGNRRAMGDAAARLAKLPDETAVITLDIDHFKQVNDQYGHAAGDRALVCVAEVLRAALRSEDGAFRVGGEEFVVLIARCNEVDAGKAAERIRARMESRAIDLGPKVVSVTVSLGVAIWRGGITIDDALETADRALYAAKHSGRNRVCIGR
jgi:diguanylate cyclase